MRNELGKQKKDCTQLSLRVVIHINGLVQDCSNSIANELELLQSCTKPSIYVLANWIIVGSDNGL